MLTENVPHQVKPGWYPFDGQLSPTQRSFASELRDVRNEWAHMKSFSDDDAYRALDTGERFLSGIGAAAAAEEVRGLRLELRRVASDKDDRKALKSAVVMPESEGLAPWREVLPPHDDVATGNFQAAEFAADLYKVSTRSVDAGDDYAEPIAFFSRTYLTEGLRDLIGRTIRRLGGDDNASPVDQPADELRRRQDALDASPLASGLRLAAFRLWPGRPGPAARQRLRRAWPGSIAWP